MEATMCYINGKACECDGPPCPYDVDAEHKVED